MLHVNKKPIFSSNYLIDPLDIYLFDSQGLCIVKNVIPLDQIKEAKETINQKFPNKKPWKFGVLGLGDVFWNLMINSKMLAIAEHLCGDQFRLDHAFSVTSDAEIINLHGGPCSSYGSCFTNVDGQLLVGQLSCGIPLVEQNEETGGMCYIPGTHKSIDTRSGRLIRKELYHGNIKHDSIIVPKLELGDLVVFSESVVHGDNGWFDKNNTRIIVYYKFFPGFMTWRDPREQEKYVDMAKNDLQRRLLEPPWSGKFKEDKDFIMDINNQRRVKVIQ